MHGLKKKKQHQKEGLLYLNPKLLAVQEETRQPHDHFLSMQIVKKKDYGKDLSPQKKCMFIYLLVLEYLSLLLSTIIQKEDRPSNCSANTDHMDLIM